MDNFKLQPIYGRIIYINLSERNDFMETYDLQDIWGKLVEKLRLAISETNINMYIKQIKPLKMESTYPAKIFSCHDCYFKRYNK